MAQHTSSGTTAPTIPLALPIQGGAYLVMIVPFDEGERQAQAMENWLQACATDEPFALELVGTGREQRFLLRASSREHLSLLCKQLEAQYPQAEIEQVDPTADPLVLHPGEHAVLGEFALSQPAWMPLKTFGGKMLVDAGSDPLAGILAAMEAVGSEERLIAQLALVRAPEHWIGRDLRKSVEHPLQPERDQHLNASRGYSSAGDIQRGLQLLVGILMVMGALWGNRLYHEHAYSLLTLLASLTCVALVVFLWWKLHTPGNTLYDMQLVSEKLARAGFYTQLRVVAIGKSSSTNQALRSHLLRMEVAYRQFTLTNANALYLKRIRRLSATQTPAARLVHPKYAFPYHHWLLRLLHAGAPGKDVWNALELAGAFHPPQEGTDVPLVRRISVKQLLFPPQIAYQIEHTAAPLLPVHIGHSGQRGSRIAVPLPFSTVFSRLCLVGRSRSGKSVLMQHLLQAVMQRVRDGSLQPGVFCIDPHHDLIEDLLALIPTDRMSAVLLLDLTDTQFPVALNPLDASMGFTRDQAVSNLMACFKQIWSEFWGPRMAYFLKNVCLLLYTLNERLVAEGRADEQYTLLDINPLLQYQDYAISVLSQLDMSEMWHQELLAWWKNTYFTLPRHGSFRQEVIMPILSKMGVFNDNQQLRRIVGQPVTKAPIHEAVTTGKIVLCALSSRDYDDDAINILGSTLINLLHRAFGSQIDVPLAARRRVFVAIDELQAFSGGDYDKLLSEDGKYGCALLLATQNLKRLNKIRDGLLEMLLSNCETLFAFAVSAADASMLSEELQEKVSQKHIISQPRLHCYGRIQLADYPLVIASIKLKEPASWQRTPAQIQQVADIRSATQARYLPASEVDRQHTAHLRRFLDVDLPGKKVRWEAADQESTRQQQKAAAAHAAARPPTENMAPGAASGTPADAATMPPSTTGKQGGRGKSRNHRRSRRVGQKHPVGQPPPDLPEAADEQDEQVHLPPITGGRGPSGRERELTSIDFLGKKVRKEEQAVVIC